MQQKVKERKENKRKTKRQKDLERTTRMPHFQMMLTPSLEKKVDQEGQNQQDTETGKEKEDVSIFDLVARY